MTKEKAISLLKEMLENCEKGGKYNDPKRNEKAEALKIAIAAVAEEKVSA